LVLVNNTIGDGEARALAGCPALAGLRLLGLSTNRIGDEGAIALLESPHLRGLDDLWLDANPNITEPVLRRIEERFGPQER
jgi:hypothetical protein